MKILVMTLILLHLSMILHQMGTSISNDEEESIELDYITTSSDYSADKELTEPIELDTVISIRDSPEDEELNTFLFEPMISYSNDEECIIFSKDESLDSDLLMAEDSDQDSTEPAQSVENGEFLKLLDELIQPSWIHSSLFPHPPTLHAADLPPPEPPPEPPPWCSLWTNFGEMSFVSILFANLSIAISLMMGSMGSTICCDYLKCLQTES